MRDWLPDSCRLDRRRKESGGDPGEPSIEPPPPGHVGLSAASKMFHMLASRVGPDGSKGASVHFRSLAAAFARLGIALDVTMVRAGDGLLFAWTDAGDPVQVRTAYATLR